MAGFPLYAFLDVPEEVAVQNRFRAAALAEALHSEMGGGTLRGLDRGHRPVVPLHDHLHALLDLARTPYGSRARSASLMRSVLITS
jgi:hypothetical protein